MQCGACCTDQSTFLSYSHSTDRPKRARSSPLFVNQLHARRERLQGPEESLPERGVRKRPRTVWVEPPTEYTFGEEVSARLTECNLQKLDRLSARSTQEKMHTRSAASTREMGKVLLSRCRHPLVGRHEVSRTICYQDRELQPS